MLIPFFMALLLMQVRGSSWIIRVGCGKQQEETVALWHGARDAGAAHTQWVDVQKMNAINTDNCAFQQLAATSNVIRNVRCKICMASL